MLCFRAFSGAISCETKIKEKYDQKKTNNKKPTTKNKQKKPETFLQIKKILFLFFFGMSIFNEFPICLPSQCVVTKKKTRAARTSFADINAVRTQ